MTDEKKKVDVKETADSIIRETKAKSYLPACSSSLQFLLSRWRLSPRWQLLAATKKPVLFLHTLLCIPYLLHF